MRYDIQQLTELLINRITVESFIEIGSRDGHDTDYIAQYWNLDPANCYIIEAHPICYQNIVDMYPYFNTLNIAASNKTEPIVFNAGIFGEEDNVGISSVLDRTISPFISEKVQVDAWRLDEVLTHFNIDGIDLAKIDVEGFALEVLQGLGDKLKTFKALQIELETKKVWEGQHYYKDIVRYLSQHDFVILSDIKLDEYQNDVLFIRKDL